MATSSALSNGREIAISIGLQVRCYSGHTYPQRPLSFTLGEREHRVREVLRTWREPGRVLFRVATEEGLAFILEYDEAEDTWRLLDEPSQMLQNRMGD